MKDETQYYFDLLCDLSTEDHHSFEYHHQLEKPMELPFFTWATTIRLHSVSIVFLLITHIIGN